MFPRPPQAQAARSSAKQLSYLRQANLARDYYAKQMNDHNSNGYKAMEALKQKLADAALTENHAAHVKDADVQGKQHAALSSPMMPAISPVTHAIQASTRDSNEATGSSEFAGSQSVHLAASFSDTNGTNGLYETVPAAQQQNKDVDTILSGLAGALTIAPPAFNDDNVHPNLFNNDHLTGQMVPLEDPAEAAALSQSTVPTEIRIKRSRQLNLLTCGPNQLPTAAVGLSDDNFPFVEGARLACATSGYGVIRLRDIPEATRRSEVLAIMGRNSKVLNDVQEPVHIIIERVNAATREAYVEFMDEKSAIDVIEKFERDSRDGHPPRLGGHRTTYELSSQAALMKAVLPQARGVQWIGATPHVIPDYECKFSWERFKGFISIEEMFVLAKHGESNKATGKCPQRPYECMISTLRKMPWYMTDHITVHERYSMFDATVRLITSLQKHIKFSNNVYLLNKQLLDRLTISAMMCHGFTVTQKDDIAYLVEMSEERMRDFNMPSFASKWNHTFSLVPKPGTPLDVLEWYIAIIREATTSEVERLPPNELQEIRRQAACTSSLYWGYYWKILRLGDLAGPFFDNMTLGELARREFYVVTGILSHVFGGQHPGLEQQQSPDQFHVAQQQLIDPFLEQQQVTEGQQFWPNGHQQLIDPFQQQQQITEGQQFGLNDHQQLIDPFQQQKVGESQQFGPGGQ
ncbi:hypothetical protein N0V82_006305 [Gnomoniopsis sp. IMI 355080]|nr:hypothetical protein N0V82_006305 [Gnomoniopsis sp. IMI 355080]